MPSKDDTKKEIYHFIEDTFLESEEPVVLQTILNKFCKKYKVSETTITRYLEELVNSKSPFRLITWYDKNRYYGVRTVSRRATYIIVVAMSSILLSLFLDFAYMLQFTIFEKIVLLWAGFSIASIINFLSKGDRSRNKRFL